MSYSTEFYVFYGLAFPQDEPAVDVVGNPVELEDSDCYPDDASFDFGDARYALRAVGVRIWTWGDFWGSRTGRGLYVRESWTRQPKDDENVVTLPPVLLHWDAAIGTACRVLGIAPAKKPAWQFVSVTS